MMLAENCDIEPVFMTKTGYECFREGSVFDGKFKEKWCFVLGMIFGKIMPKTNKF